MGGLWPHARLPGLTLQSGSLAMVSRWIGRSIPARRASASTVAVSASLDAISKADAAMSRWVIAAGLKLIVVLIDST